MHTPVPAHKQGSKRLTPEESAALFAASQRAKPIAPSPKASGGISAGHKANFETLKRACDNGDLALLECTDVVSGKPVIVIAAVGRDDGDYTFFPLAKMFDGNPYDELNPPS